MFALTLGDAGSLGADRDGIRLCDGFHRRKSDSRAVRIVLRARMSARPTDAPLGNSPLGKEYPGDPGPLKQANAPKLPVTPENIPDGLRLTFVDRNTTVADVIP